MKNISILLIIVVMLLSAGCSENKDGSEISANIEIGKATEVASDTLSIFDNYTNERIVQNTKGINPSRNQSYYQHIIDTINSNSFLATDGSDDNIEGLSKALQMCNERFNEPEEIILIAQNPNNKLIIGEISEKFWFQELLLICLSNGKIEYIKILDSVLSSSTSMVKFGGFDDYFIQTYTASHQGNGVMKLLIFDKEAKIVGEFKVVDYHFEGRQGISDIINKYNLSENELISYIFGNKDDENYGMLYPNYIDINNDGYDDVQFIGIQTLYSCKPDSEGSSKDYKTDQFDIKLTYIYNSQNKVFELNVATSILPNMWESD